MTAAHSHSVSSKRHGKVMSFDANVIPKCELYRKTINQKEGGQKWLSVTRSTSSNVLSLTAGKTLPTANGSPVLSFVVAVAFAIAGFLTPPKGELHDSNLYLIVQFLLVTTSIFGVSSIISYNFRKVFINVSIVKISSIMLHILTLSFCDYDWIL